MKASSRFLFIGPLVITLCGCGSTAEEDTSLVDLIGKKEQAFKHGPPPGEAPYDYFLTTYGGPNDPVANGTPACGGKAIDGTWYYSTGAYTFGCGTKLKIEANGKCVIVKVVDNGPASWVESKAKQTCGGLGYIIDSSPLVSKYLFGTSSAGYVDCFLLRVTPIEADAPMGPVSCEAGAELVTDRFIGEACTSNESCSEGQCLSELEDEFPSGMCTQACQDYCPDQSDHAGTFCVDLGSGEGQCVSRCDYDRFDNGCRKGYRCVKMARNTQPSVQRNVCLPEGKADLMGGPPDAEGNLPNPEVDPTQKTMGLACSLPSGSAVFGSMRDLPSMALIFLLILQPFRKRRASHR
jgi:hypothetical protein